MRAASSFRLPQLLLPRPDLALPRWCVIACDQYTSDPGYWQRVEHEVGDAPSALQLIYPEVHLASPDKSERIARVQAAMRRYGDQGLLRPHDGAVLVERTLPDGRVRRGLMLELDLEQYDYTPGSASPIRPTEGTIVERIAPRIELRQDAELELPHILVLIDDPAHTVIEPLAAQRERLAPLYDTALMLGGGRVAGFAPDTELQAQAVNALQALGDGAAFAARHGLPAGTPPMLFAVGDGNHSLATAKACWERIKATAGADHPARWALVEVENIHDPAMAFAPIHRLLLGVTADLRTALAAHFGSRLQIVDQPDAATLRAALAALPREVHAAGLLQPGGRHALVLVHGAPAAQLDVASFQGFVDALLAQGGAREVDYVHGDDALARLAGQEGHAGLHLATLGKSELIARVAQHGPLPRKSFSMGEADEKRFYLEARRIRP
ncbi:DUF1015 domain-containing protein [Rubrivivax gelatinosus]|uniref:DUF1015 domain-containing protein n=1 Tax=Rubrivivax gelatinosus TaxID=28068 RepID=A0ABS1E213_RUBGE|nr:DUF1015 domain-containing protein [Rubrivivax gelatinosus]MBK1714932.1 hypothetical protein [Rubrivivax gelatinosus]